VAAPAEAGARLDCTAQADAKLKAEVAAGTAPRGGFIRDADAVIATLRPRFKACYQRGLSVDPSAQGCVVLRTFVAPMGSVEKSEVYVREGLSEAVLTCIIDAVSHAKFTAPGGSGSALQVPVTLVLPERGKP